jgi:putative MATE family efflux protein
MSLGVSSRGVGVWALAWPTVLTNLLQALVGFVDVKAVGTLGTEAVAAATSGMRLFFVQQGLLMAVGVGTTALVARAIGAGEADEAARVLTISLRLAFLVALVMGGFGMALAAPFATLSGLRGGAHALAIEYIRVLSASAPCFALSVIICSGMRAAGDVITPLAIGAISNVANVCALYLFVRGGFGAPKLGIAGAGLSACIAFSVGAGLAFAWFQSGRLRIKPARTRGSFAVHARALLRIGAPAALEQLVVQGGFIAFTAIIAHFYGTAALAAYGIGVQILSLSIVVGFGFSIASATLVGQHLGAGDPLRAAQSGWRAMALAVSSMTLVSIVIIASARVLARNMIADEAVIEHAVALIRLLGAAQPLMGVEFALAGALRGAGDTRFPLFTTFTGLILGRVALATALTWFGAPVVWIYATLLADYALKSVLLVTRFRSGRWRGATSPGAVIPPAVELETAM